MRVGRSMDVCLCLERPRGPQQSTVTWVAVNQIIPQYKLPRTKALGEELLLSSGSIHIADPGKIPVKYVRLWMSFRVFACVMVGLNLC